jgi:hypothetical protein
MREWAVGLWLCGEKRAGSWCWGLGVGERERAREFI